MPAMVDSDGPRESLIRSRRYAVARYGEADLRGGWIGASDRAGERAIIAVEARDVGHRTARCAGSRGDFGRVDVGKG
jgi:hypothetical protein